MIGAGPTGQQVLFSFCVAGRLLFFFAKKAEDDVVVIDPVSLFRFFPCSFQRKAEAFGDISPFPSLNRINCSLIKASVSSGFVTEPGQGSQFQR